MGGCKASKDIYEIYEKVKAREDFIISAFTKATSIKEEDMYICDEEGMTPVHDAVNWYTGMFKRMVIEHPKTVEKLLGFQNRAGKTCLDLAMYNNTNSLKLLLEKYPRTVVTILNQQSVIQREVMFESCSSRERIALLKHFMQEKGIKEIEKPKSIEANKKETV